MLWNPQSQANSSLVIATQNGTWVDIIFDVSGSATTLQPGHPIHKHSNMVYVLVSYLAFFFCCLRLTMNQGAGTGKFNWTSVAEARKEIPDLFNLVNPPMRGTIFELPWNGFELEKSSRVL
jgi:hypothetical protein